jgi:hypothetical protein
LGQLIWREDSSVGLFVKIGEETAVESLITKQRIRYFELVGHQRLDSNVKSVTATAAKNKKDSAEKSRFLPRFGGDI